MHGQITLDGAMDVSITNAEALLRAIGWQIQAMGGRVTDVKPEALSVKFGDAEYIIAAQEVGIWGRKHAATQGALNARAKAERSTTGVGFRAIARDREKKYLR